MKNRGSSFNVTDHVFPKGFMWHAESRHLTNPTGKNQSTCRRVSIKTKRAFCERVREYHTNVQQLISIAQELTALGDGGYIAPDVDLFGLAEVSRKLFDVYNAVDEIFMDISLYDHNESLQGILLAAQLLSEYTKGAIEGIEPGIFSAMGATVGDMHGRLTALGRKLTHL